MINPLSDDLAPSLPADLRSRESFRASGFAPMCFTLATKYHLTGNVANTSAGVIIHAQGLPDAVDAFQS